MGGKEAKMKIVVDAENRAQAVFNDLQRNLDAVKKTNDGIISAMKTVGTAGAVAFGGLSLMTKGMIEQAAGFEQTQIAFTTMLGSAQLAQKTLADLTSFAAKTPFQLPQVEESAKKLLAYGVEAKDLIPTLTTLGDISAGVGMDKMPQLILAFGQVKAATHLTGMELRQFSEAGVPLIDALAQHFHVAAADVQKMVSDGKVGFTDVQAALVSLTGESGRFHDLMEKQSHSLSGEWSNLQDAITLTARSIGTELLPYLKPLVENLINLTTEIGNFVKLHPQLSAIILVATLGFTGIMAALLPIALALPGIILLWNGLGAAFTFVALGPGGYIIAAIIAIGAALLYLYQQGYFTKQAWQEVWVGIKLFAAEGANAVIGTVEGMVNFIINGVNSAIRAINSIIKLAQKVPGLGSKISTIGEISAVDFGTYDTNAIASSLVNGSGSTSQTTVNVTGNTFLSEDAATKMGDLILGRLKLSNAL